MNSNASPRGTASKFAKNSEVTPVDPDDRSVTITDNAHQTAEELAYDLLHVVPRQSAPDWIKASPISDPDNPGGYVQIDKNTMRHTRFGNIFALEMPGRHRTQKPAPPSASKHP